MHALIKKIDGVSKEIKEVETVCILLQQTGSWTKKTILYILDGQFP